VHVLVTILFSIETKLSANQFISRGVGLSVTSICYNHTEPPICV
jgi:hypothetical protein